MKIEEKDLKMLLLKMYLNEHRIKVCMTCKSFYSILFYEMFSVSVQYSALSQPRHL